MRRTGKLALGIDIGTTGVKVSAVDLVTTRVIATSRENALHSHGPGIAEASTSQWHTNVIECIAELMAHPDIDPATVCAISSTGMVPAVVLVDSSGSVLRNAILQSDARATTEIRIVSEALEGTDPIAATGSAITQQSIAPTTLWLQQHEPAVLGAARYIVGSYDWVLMALGAEPHVERNWALESGLYTIGGDAFAPARHAGQIGDEQLPPVRDPGTVVGSLRSDLARDLGLPSETALVVGGADHVLSAYSAGVQSEGDWLIKLGGAGDILAASTIPITDRRLYLDAHPIPDLWLPNGCMATSGSLIRWFQNLVGGVDLRLLDEEAERESPGEVLCAPYFLGEKSPLHDPDLRGAFIGMHLGTSRGALYRSVLEAIAFGFRHHVEVFSELGIPLRRAMITNGGSKSTLWKHIHADVLGVPVHPIRDHPGASLGAAVLGGVGAGVLASPASIRDFVNVDEPILPDASRHRTYDDVYAAWREFTRVTTPTAHYLAEREGR